METAQAAARKAIWDYHAIIEDAEQALDASGGECTPEYSALEALASDTLEYALEQIKLARTELDAKAEANKALAAKYTARKQTYEAQVKRLDEEALALFAHADKDKVVTPTGTIARRSSERVDVDETDLSVLQGLSDMFLAEPTWKIDRRAIGTQLRKKVALPGCRLVAGKDWVDYR